MKRVRSTAYGDYEVRAVHVPGAINVEQPVAGCYRMRLRAGGVPVGIRIWHGPPNDPVTGEELDRSHRWQAVADDGEVLDFDRCWPACAKDKITMADFRALEKRRAWARESAPGTAYADKSQRLNPLSHRNPMLF